jgi:hypothetical protein
MKRIYLTAIKQKGQILPIVVILLVVLLGFATLLTDAGSMTLSRRELQNAADSAALAGAQNLPDYPSQAITDATTYATTNGKTGDTVTVTVGSDNKSITVKIVRQSPSFFGKIFKKSSSTVVADATAKVGVAASVPWIVPFVIPKPTAFNYDNEYVMRMYGSGDFLAQDISAGEVLSSTGYPKYNEYSCGSYSNNTLYKYPTDWTTDSVYKNYPLTPIGSRYPYQFDYMNVYITAASSFNDYINWLKTGYHTTFSISDKMYYYAPSSGGEQSIDAFSVRLSSDPNTDYTKAKIGDARVMLIPVVNSVLPRNTAVKTQMSIIGFVGFFVEEVHKNNCGTSFWFQGRFLKDLNIGTGEVTYDPNADFGLRVVTLSE